MKANELRIGDWVKWNYEESSDGNAYPVEYGYELDDIKNNPNIVKPIPLTEEWLERFGFEKDEEYDEGGLVDYRWILMNGSLEFVSFWNSEELTGVNQPQTGVDIEHVHSLQNLYFALTGEELNQNKYDGQKSSFAIYQRKARGTQ